jgi:PilZ domain
MSTTSNLPNHPSPRRRSQRVLMQVGVKVRGSDAQGKSFEEEALTLAINAHGALVQLQARLASGSKVLLQHKHTKEEQECHVVFLGPVRSGKAEIGLEFTEACPSFWRVAFPPEDWTPKHPEARSVIPTTVPALKK